eukprot:TRINITY_DN15348_c0_g1_i1.p1 TRINITY_DN15348_c0_g1~~TRINITY_DN15348_c0_g1_i1.p1  ORF type:complete len:257 (-),score=56.39 TRINITY_DN15348_c0_g1_i1:14-760(-)
MAVPSYAPSFGSPAVGAPAQRDPFYRAKAEIQDTLKKLEESFERWEVAIRTSDTIGIVTQADATNNNVAEIEELLLDVEETIQIVEQDRARFNIDDVEINSRKNFVTSTKKRVDVIKNELRKDSENRKKGKKGKGRYDDISKANDEFIEGEAQAQDQIYADQEIHLDALQHTVGQLGEVSNAMRIELEEQNVMLDEINQEADETDGMLKGANKQITELLKHASKSGLTWAMVILGAILLLVIFMALSF